MFIQVDNKNALEEMVALLLGCAVVEILAIAFMLIVLIKTIKD